MSGKGIPSRLTACKQALAIIRDYRPLSARVPLGAGRGTETVKRLALEVAYIEVVGAEREGLWGDPKDIEQDESLRLWSEKLREPGDAGYTI